MSDVKENRNLSVSHCVSLSIITLGLLLVYLMGSWKRRIRSDTDVDTNTDIFKIHFYIYKTVIFHN